MKWGMVVDLSKCVRCYGCVIACRIEHFLPMGGDWSRLMAVEPDGGGTTPVVSTFRINTAQRKNAISAWNGSMRGGEKG